MSVVSIFTSHFLLPLSFFFFFNDTATTEIYTLSLHDALPILARPARWSRSAPCGGRRGWGCSPCRSIGRSRRRASSPSRRSEEHTSELQSQSNLVCRLLLEKKKKWFNDTLFNDHNHPRRALWS